MKKRTLHDLVDQGPEAVIVIASPLDDPLDVGTVERRGFRTSGVGEEFLGQVAGKLVFVSKKELLELIDVLKTASIL